MRWLVAWVLLIGPLLPAAVAGGAGAQSPQEADGQLPLLEDVDRLAGVLEAEDRREITPSLRGLVADESPVVRARAALALARVGAPTSVALLESLIADPSAEVRRLAAFALGRLDYHFAASGGALRSRARDLLLPLLNDEPVVAAQAAWALSRVDPGAGQVVGDWLRRNEPAAQVLSATLASWWRYEGAELSLPADYLEHADADVRLAATHAVRRLDNPGGLPLLVARLDDEDPEVRLMAGRGLTPVPAAVAEQHATPRLSERDPRLVCALLDWLRESWLAEGRAGDEAFTAVLRRSLDRSLHVRRCALAALGAVVATRAVAADRLLEAVAEAEPSVRARALDALAVAEPRLRDAAVRRLSDGIAGGENPDRRVEAWLEHPAVATAVASLVAAGSDPAARQAWLALDDDAAAMPLLRALVESEPALVLERLVTGLDGAGPAELGLLAAVQRRTPGTLDAERHEAVTEQLWRRYFDSPPDRPERRAALEAFEAFAPGVAERRRELVFADADRVVRGWAIGRWGEVDALPGLDVLLAPTWTGREPQDYSVLAARVADLGRPRLRLLTERGEAVLELRPDWAPLTVLQFLDLVDAGFFEGSLFHRVIAGFVSQGGGEPAGGFAPTLRNEDSAVSFERGMVGLALAGRDTGRSQFFITHARQPHLRGEYPVFARVLEGQRVVERIQPGDAMRLQREAGER